MISAFENSDSWVILSTIEMQIKEKIERVGVPLKDWDISINYGIKTGFNEAFIISGEKRKELIEQDPKSEEIIRPILRGRDIKRYSYDFADLWLLHIPWHFPLHKHKDIIGASQEAEDAFEQNYPAIYKHLLQHKESLSNRNKAETGIRYEWYALQRWGANYSDDFSKQKIVWKRVGSILKFCLDSSGAFALDSTCFATGKDIEYILCFLNSTIGNYLLRDSPKTGTGDLLISVQAIEPIIVPLATKEVAEKINKLLDELISTRNPNYEFLINEVFYNLLSLDTEEITFLEANQ